MVKVYISSTFADMQQERRDAGEWIAKANHQPVDSYTASSATVQESCSADVAKCDIYVLILGGRYGGRPPGADPMGPSITHLEFLQAIKFKRPVIALVREPPRPDLHDPVDQRCAEDLRKAVEAHCRTALYKSEKEFVGHLVIGVTELARRMHWQSGHPDEVGGLDLVACAAALDSVSPGFPGAHRARQIGAFCKAQVIENDGHAIPFVARTEAFRDLNVWLDTPGAPRKALLTGGAGSGKSTLLVRWLAPIATDSEWSSLAKWHCVFVPISQRFGTHNAADWQMLLCLRLATVLDCALSPDIRGSGTDEGLRGELHRLCLLAIDQRRRVLILVDGIDESLGGAFTAEWFPPDAPEHLRLLVSARAQSGGAETWRRQLRWEAAGAAISMIMPALTRQELLTMLSEHFQRVNAERIDALTQQIIRLSDGGDPIVCRYILAELSQAIDIDGRWDEDRVAGWTQGLRGFFERWIHDIGKIEFAPAGNNTVANRIDTLNQTLGVLAVAPGALPLRALADLVRLATNGRMVPTGADLALLSRWVLQVRHDPAQPDSVGYTLAHPRLNEFLAEALELESQAAEQAFGAWCADAIGHCTVAKPHAGVVRYLTHYAGLHLLRANPRELWRLMPKAWKDLSLKTSGSLKLYARDVVLCFNAATEAEFDWPQAISCQILRASIRERETLPARLLGVLVHHKVLTLEQAHEWLPGEPQTIEVVNRDLALANVGLARDLSSADRAAMARRLLAVCNQADAQFETGVWSHWCIALVDLARRIEEPEHEKLRGELEDAALKLLWRGVNRLDFYQRLSFIVPRVRKLCRLKLLEEILRRNCTDPWERVAKVLDYLPWDEACAYARLLDIPDDAVVHLLPWLPADEWAWAKAQVLNQLREVANNECEYTRGVNGFGEAQALARFAALDSATPDLAAAEMAFAILPRINHLSDRLWAAGQLLNHSSGAFEAKVRSYALSQVRDSFNTSGFTRIDDLAQPGAFLGRDVSDVVALAETLPRDAGLQIVSYVADELTPALAARTWQYALTARHGDEAQQWLCRAQFADVQGPTERAEVVQGLVTYSGELNASNALRGVDDAVYLPLAERLLACVDWTNFFNSPRKALYSALLGRASPALVMKILEAVASQNASHEYWEEPLDSAAHVTNESQLPSAVLLAMLEQGQASRDQTSSRKDHARDRLCKGLQQRGRESYEPALPVDLAHLAELLREPPPRKELLKRIVAEAPNLRLLDASTRRRLYDGMCLAFEAFP